MKLLKYIYLVAMAVCLGLAVLALDTSSTREHAWVFVVGAAAMAALALAAQYFEDRKPKS